MSGLTREQILGVVDLKPVEVQVPEWNSSVWIRPMTAAERAEWEGYISGDAGKNGAVKQARERLAVLSICDSDGSRQFTNEDIDVLAKKNATALERVGMAAMRLNKLRPKDIEELAKN